MNDIVCNCLGISDTEIKDAIKEKKLTSVDEVGELTAAGIACGDCISDIEKLLGIK